MREFLPLLWNALNITILLFLVPDLQGSWTLLLTASSSTEDFSYFTLLRPARDGAPASSLFGISCTRQMDASTLLTRPADVTRSTVQKAVVVIAGSPQQFGMLRERLSVVTTAWFAQREFADTEILRRFQESLREENERGGANDDDREEYLGMSLRELVKEFKWQTLVLFKCCLLQPKVWSWWVWVMERVLTTLDALLWIAM